MTAPVLSSSLGEGGAFIGDSHGNDNLLAILTNIVKAGAPLAVRQATIATAILIRQVAQFDGVIGDIGLHATVCGTAGSTVVKVNKNGTALATFPTAIEHDDADGTSSSTDLSGDAEAAFVAGDIIDIEVTTAPTAGENLDVVLHLRPASIQP